MGRRYYCEYCDKTFIDELEARKKHLQSSHHIKMRNMHYEQCRDLPTLLKEELLKTPCRKYFTSGTCSFEGTCKYTHYNMEQLCHIRHQVEQMQRAKQQKQQEKMKLPSVESWLDKYEELSNIGGSVVPPWKYPGSLLSRTDLPPSLVKFSAEHFHDDEFEVWGV